MPLGIKNTRKNREISFNLLPERTKVKVDLMPSLLLVNNRNSCCDIKERTEKKLKDKEEEERIYNITERI